MNVPGWNDQCLNSIRIRDILVATRFDGSGSSDFYKI